MEKRPPHQETPRQPPPSSGRRTNGSGGSPAPPWLWLLLIGGFAFIFWQFVPKTEIQVEYYPWFIEQVDSDNIKSISIQGNELRGELRKEQQYLNPANLTTTLVRKFMTNTPSEASVEPIVQKLIQNDKKSPSEGNKTVAPIRIDPQPPNSASGLAWIMLLLPTFVILGFIYLMLRRSREISSRSDLSSKTTGAPGASTMSAITSAQSPANSAVSVPEPVHAVSELIDATETLYRLTVEEYEQIAGFLDDDRVELIDGYLVKKKVKTPPHVVTCARVLAAVARIAPAGWHTRPGEPIRITGSTEPEPDVALARGVIDDYGSRHPEPGDIALVVEVADTTLAKDRRRTRTYGPAGIPVYWILNLAGRRVEVYTGPSADGYAPRVDYAPGAFIPLVIDGETVGQVGVADILP